MSETKLFPCPFCGGEATLANIFGRNGVICKECEAMFRMHMDETEQDAIKAWNTRKLMEDIVERLQEKDDDCGCGKISVWEAIDIVRNAGKEVKP